MFYPDPPRCQDCTGHHWPELPHGCLECGEDTVDAPPLDGWIYLCAKHRAEYEAEAAAEVGKAPA